MMYRALFLIRIVATLLLVIFSTSLLHDFGYAHANPSQDSPFLSLPPHVGTIVDTYQGTSAETIYCIQDVHCHPTTQKNICTILQSLKRSYRDNLNVIGVEGNVGHIDVSSIEKIRDRKKKQRIVTYLLQQGYITGPELYALSDPTIPLYGLENEQLYLKNFNLLYQSLHYRHVVENIIRRTSMLLARWKELLYPHTLDEMEKQKATLPTEQYLLYLEQNAQQHGINLEREYPTIATFLVHTRLQNALSIPLLHIETTHLIQQLQTLISPQDWHTLKQTMKTGDGYTFLYDLVTYYKIPTSRAYPELTNYFGLLAQKRSIDMLRLSEETDALEYRIQSLLVKHRRDATQLLACNYYTQLFERYVSNKVSSYDREEWEKVRTTWHTHLDACMQRLCAPHDRGYNKAGLETADNVMKSFYDTASKRNDVLAHTMLDVLTKQKSRIGVMIVGGFHTQGITAFLRSKGISYTVIMPTVTGTISDEVYLRRIREQAALYSQIKENASFPHSLNTPLLLPQSLGLRSGFQTGEIQAKIPMLEHSMELFHPVSAREQRRIQPANVLRGVAALSGVSFLRWLAFRPRREAAVLPAAAPLAQAEGVAGAAAPQPDAVLPLSPLSLSRQEFLQYEEEPKVQDLLLRVVFPLSQPAPSQQQSDMAAHLAERASLYGWDVQVVKSEIPGIITQRKEKDWKMKMRTWWDAIRPAWNQNKWKGIGVFIWNGSRILVKSVSVFFSLWLPEKIQQCAEWLPHIPILGHILKFCVETLYNLISILVDIVWSVLTFLCIVLFPIPRSWQKNIENFFSNYKTTVYVTTGMLDALTQRQQEEHFDDLLGEIFEHEAYELYLGGVSHHDEALHSLPAKYLPAFLASIHSSLKQQLPGEEEGNQDLLQVIQRDETSGEEATQSHLVSSIGNLSIGLLGAGLMYALVPSDPEHADTMRNRTILGIAIFFGAWLIHKIKAKVWYYFSGNIKQRKAFAWMANHAASVFGILFYWIGYQLFWNIVCKKFLHGLVWKKGIKPIWSSCRNKIYAWWDPAGRLAEIIVALPQDEKEQIINTITSQLQASDPPFLRPNNFANLAAWKSSLQPLPVTIITNLLHDYPRNVQPAPAVVLLGVYFLNSAFKEFLLPILTGTDDMLERLSHLVQKLRQLYYEHPTPNTPIVQAFIDTIREIWNGTSLTRVRHSNGDTPFVASQQEEGHMVIYVSSGMERILSIIQNIVPPVLFSALLKDIAIHEGSELAYGGGLEAHQRALNDDGSDVLRQFLRVIDILSTNETRMHDDSYVEGIVRDVFKDYLDPVHYELVYRDWILRLYQKGRDGEFVTGKCVAHDDIFNDVVIEITGTHDGGRIETFKRHSFQRQEYYDATGRLRRVDRSGIWTEYNYTPSGVLQSVASFDKTNGKRWGFRLYRGENIWAYLYDVFYKRIFRIEEKDVQLDPSGKPLIRYYWEIAYYTSSGKLKTARRYTNARKPELVRMVEWHGGRRSRDTEYYKENGEDVERVREYHYERDTGRLTEEEDSVASPPHSVTQKAITHFGDDGYATEREWEYYIEETVSTKTTLLMVLTRRTLKRAIQYPIPQEGERLVEGKIVQGKDMGERVRIAIEEDIVDALEREMAYDVQSRDEHGDSDREEEAEGEAEREATAATPLLPREGMEIRHRRGGYRPIQRERSLWRDMDRGEWRIPSMRNHVMYLPDGRLLATSIVNTTGYVWDVISGRMLTTIPVHMDFVESIIYSPDGKTFAIGTMNDIVRVWDVSSGTCLHTLKGRHVAYSPDGKTLATGSMDCGVRVWDVSSGTCMSTLTAGDMGALMSLVYSPDGKSIATGSWDPMVRLWDVSNRRCMSTLAGHTNSVGGIAYAPDGKTLATGSNDRTVRVWEVSSGKCMRMLIGHTGSVTDVVYSPNGNTLATGSDDNTVRVWDVSTGECMNVLTGHMYGQWHISIVYSPAGNTLATERNDGTVRIWDVSTGKCLSVHTMQSPERALLALGTDLHGASESSSLTISFDDFMHGGEPSERRERQRLLMDPTMFQILRLLQKSLPRERLNSILDDVYEYLQRSVNAPPLYRYDFSVASFTAERKSALALFRTIDSTTEISSEREAVQQLNELLHREHGSIIIDLRRVREASQTNKQVQTIRTMVAQRNYRSSQDVAYLNHELLRLVYKEECPQFYGAVVEQRGYTFFKIVPSLERLVRGDYMFTREGIELLQRDLERVTAELEIPREALIPHLNNLRKKWKTRGITRHVISEEVTEELLPDGSVVNVQRDGDGRVCDIKIVQAPVLEYDFLIQVVGNDRLTELVKTIQEERRDRYTFQHVLQILLHPFDPFESLREISITLALPRATVYTIPETDVLQLRHLYSAA